MIILLVNDDGFNSKRLELTKNILSKFGSVYVVVPMKEQSGKSMAITLGDVSFTKHNDFMYSVNGTPVDCISFAIFGLKINPDFVVSGINEGFNIGIDTFYSGTVGAAFQAQYYGYKAVAFSGDSSGDRNILRYFESTIDFVLENNMLSDKYILNINFPKEKFNHDSQVVMTEPFFVKMKLEVDVFEGKFISRRRVLDTYLPTNTDVYALRNGAISISKLYLTRKNN